MNDRDPACACACHDEERAFEVRYQADVEDQRQWELCWEAIRKKLYERPGQHLRRQTLR